MADNRLKLAQGLRNLPDSAREDLAGYSDGFSKSQIADALRNAGEQGIGIAKSVARGIPQMATGFVDLAAMPFEAAGIVKPGQSVGSTKWLEEKGYLPPPQEGFVNQTAEMVASGLDPSTWASHALPLVAGIGKTVWHGSPHMFDKFDLSKIGTGEGAQAYGHGLYFADRPAEAMKYQPRDIEVENKLMKKYEAAQNANDYTSAQIYEDLLAQKTPEEIGGYLGEYFQGKDLEKAQKALDIGKQLYGQQTAGGLYKVDIPDEKIAQMLDYFKPLSEQPEYVRNALNNAPFEVRAGGDYSGADIYDMAQSYAAPKMGEKNPAGGSALLNELGIPGIKYAEQKYIAKPNLTPDYNYVVFDENMPQILERNSQPLVNALRDKKPTLQPSNARLG